MNRGSMLEVHRYGKILPPEQSKSIPNKRDIRPTALERHNKSTIKRSERRVRSTMYMNRNENKRNDKSKLVIATMKPLNDSFNLEGFLERVNQNLPSSTNNRDKNTTTESNEVITKDTKQELNLSKSTTEKELKEEIEKWKEFSQLMSESYKQLKKKYAEEEEKKVNINSFESQIKNLKDLLYQSGIENRRLREMLEGNNTSVIAELKQQNNKLVEENIILRKEKEELEKLLIVKYQEKDILESEKTVANKLIQQLNAKIKVILDQYNRFSNQK